MNRYLERVVDLTDPADNDLYGLTLEEARTILLESSAVALGKVRGSFSLLAQSGKTVRMARSLDRPMRYFLAKKKEGPVLIVAARIDEIFAWLKLEGLHRQFPPELHPHGSRAPYY